MKERQRRKIDHETRITIFCAWREVVGPLCTKLLNLRLAGAVQAALVSVLRDLSLAEFRQHLRQINDPGLRYTINFHRGPLFGGGGGHHSPLGAYLEAADLVLVLDVNEEFKPWLVPAERLYQAMDTVDRDGGRKRGLLRIELPK